MTRAGWGCFAGHSLAAVNSSTDGERGSLSLSSALTNLRRGVSVMVSDDTNAMSVLIVINEMCLDVA